MFELEDLDEHSGKTMQIDGLIFTLEKHEDLSGMLAVWKNESYGYTRLHAMTVLLCLCMS